MCWGQNDSGELGLGHTNYVGRNEDVALVDHSFIGGGVNSVISRFNYEAETVSEFTFQASLTYSHSSIKSYQWDFGDGTLGTGENISHAFSGAGNYTVTLTVTDILDQTDTFSQNIEVKMPNSPPFFINSTQNVFIFSEETSFPLHEGFDSEDASRLTYSLVETPAKGTLSNCLNNTSDLTCDYTPDANSLENIYFTYKVNDGSLDSEEVVTVFLYIHPRRSPVIDISLGASHSCVLFQDGNVRCWGQNSSGQLGLGHNMKVGHHSIAHIFFEDIVDLGDEAVQISSGRNRNCAVLKSGDLKCWGSNGLFVSAFHTGNIGDDESVSSVSSISLGEKVKQVSVGSNHTCALLESGGIKCWGNNREGQLGYGHTQYVSIDSHTALEDLETLGLPKRAIKVQVSRSSTCAIIEGGELICWGHNWYGQLGQGRMDNIGDEEVDMLSTLGSVSLSEPVIDVQLGDVTTCVLFESGNTKCWGLSSYLGQSITQNIGDDETPLDLPNLSFSHLVNQISYGQYLFCALLQDGSVNCFGSGTSGQLGLGNTQTVSLASLASPISLGQNAVILESDTNRSCAVLLNGNLKCWGYNLYGQLGLGHTNNIGDDEIPIEMTIVGGEGFSIISRIQTNYVLGVVDQPMSFRGSSSYSSSGIITYSWDFGDGAGVATTEDVTYTFTQAGTYTVSLTITNTDGESHTHSQEITILGEEEEDNDDDADE